MLSDGSVSTGHLVQPLGSAHLQSTPLVREPGWRPTWHDLLNRPSSSPRARQLHLWTSGIIATSTVCFVAESLPSLHGWALWTLIDASVCVFFTLEYALRLLVAPYGRGDEDAEPARPDASARWHFARQPLSVIDLCAVVPFWLEIILSLFGTLVPLAFLQVLLALRLVRVLRLLRLAQESDELRALADCIQRVLPALRLLLFILALELLIVGGLVFHAERGELRDGVWLAAKASDVEGDDDDDASDFQSIVDAGWWALVTVTTVGYGDQVPTTWLGRLCACVAMLTGVVGLSAVVSIVGTEMAGVKSAAVATSSSRAIGTAAGIERPLHDRYTERPRDTHGLARAAAPQPALTASVGGVAATLLPSATADEIGAFAPPPLRAMPPPVGGSIAPAPLGPSRARSPAVATLRRRSLPWPSSAAEARPGILGTVPALVPSTPSFCHVSSPPQLIVGLGWLGARLGDLLIPCARCSLPRSGRYPRICDGTRAAAAEGSRRRASVLRRLRASHGAGRARLVGRRGESARAGLNPCSLLPMVAWYRESLLASLHPMVTLCSVSRHRATGVDRVTVMTWQSTRVISVTLRLQKVMKRASIGFLVGHTVRGVRIASR